MIKELTKKYDGVLVSSRSNIVYLTNYSNFSENERECFLLFTKTKQFLITDKRYSEAVDRVVKDFEIINTGIHKLLTVGHSNILKNLRITSLGIEEYDLTVSEYKRLRNIVKTKPIDLRNLRVIKQKYEIENIRKASKIGDIAFKFILGQLKNGVTEREISDLLETFINQKGADISFKPIVAFGKNSSIPHHMTGKDKLKTNQIVLFDFGVKVNNYCSDMSRTVFFGKTPDRFKKMHKTVLEAQKKAIESIRVGIRDSEIDKIARDYIISKGYPNIIHSVGHGIGIEVHEPPVLSPRSMDVLKENMVITVEPGIYIPHFGGVRIEDMVFVSKKGAQLISHAKREIIEVWLC